MTTNTIKFSQFVAGTLSNTTNKIVGVSAPSGGTNFQISFPLMWTTATRPAAGMGVLGYNSSLGQYEFWNGAAWVQLAAGGSGSVNLGSINQLAYYAANGTAVSGLNTANNSVLLTNPTGFPDWAPAVVNSILQANSGGVPSWSTTLPAGLTITTPNITGVVNASNATAGSVGEFVSSVIASASAIAMTNLTPTVDVAFITLTAGDWDVWGNAYFITSGQIAAGTAWVSSISMSLPDKSLIAQAHTPAPSADIGTPVPQLRFNLTSTTPIYLSAIGSFGSGSMSVCGGIYARRRR